MKKNLTTVVALLSIVAVVIAYSATRRHLGAQLTPDEVVPVDGWAGVRFPDAPHGLIECPKGKLPVRAVLDFRDKFAPRTLQWRLTIRVREEPELKWRKTYPPFVVAAGTDAHVPFAQDLVMPQGYYDVDAEVLEGGEPLVAWGVLARVP